MELRKLAYKKDLEALYQQVLEKKITMAQYNAAGLNMQKIMNDDIADLYKKDKEEYAARQAEKYKKAQEEKEKFDKKVEADLLKSRQLHKDDVAAQKGISENANTAIISGLQNQIKQQTTLNGAIAIQGFYSKQSADAAIKAHHVQFTFIDILKQKYGEFFNSVVEGSAELTVKVGEAISKAIKELMVEVFTNIGTMLGEALVTGDLSMKSMFNSILTSVAGFMSKLGQQFIILGTQQLAVEIGLGTMNPALVIGAGVALVAAGAATKKLMSEGITPMAKGGLLFGPQMILAGEYSGAASNPEVIAPLDKLKNLIGGNGGRVQVQGVMGGRDIYFTNQQYSRINKRITGR